MLVTAFFLQEVKVGSRDAVVLELEPPSPTFARGHSPAHAVLGPSFGPRSRQRVDRIDKRFEDP